MCPLTQAGLYDIHIHAAVAAFRLLDGSHLDESQGSSVDFFRPRGKPKYWLKEGDGASAFGPLLFHVWSNSIGPWLAKFFGMHIWDPRDKAGVDVLMDAKVTR